MALIPNNLSTATNRISGLRFEVSRQKDAIWLIIKYVRETALTFSGFRIYKETIFSHSVYRHCRARLLFRQPRTLSCRTTP